MAVAAIRGRVNDALVQCGFLLLGEDGSNATRRDRLDAHEPYSLRGRSPTFRGSWRRHPARIAIPSLTRPRADAEVRSPR